MISQLFALPLRALVIAAMLPIPPAFGADLAGQSPAPPAAISSPPAIPSLFPPSTLSVDEPDGSPPQEQP
jgi:hypothetical protein